ncbi:hypothetical protein [Streptomyces flaveolus]|uniref:hypothetical protein n=1 Tax=Streptomyces flaveolus TaxID=67297 RepID=UPI00166F6D72|nr:hypothetical protein [Streptomyces flaveolus]
MLLAEDSASQAAWKVNERLWDLLTHARDPSGASATRRAELGSTLIDALNSLHQAARADLAIGRPRAGRR